MKVVIGLSGGVDSALAARLLLEQGHQLIGVYLDIGLSDTGAAQAAAELGIPLVTVDIRSQLEDLVCRPFIDAYLSGKTPNPCLLCNPRVKFPALLRAAENHGAECIATGHYARVSYRDGYYRLLAAKSSNDQSYMLCMLGQDVLSRLLLPLGEMEKSLTRELAADASLSAAKKPDSMEICFIPDGDYAAYIEKHRGPQPCGDFVDGCGKPLGRHIGIHHYTVGQRRGLGVAAGQRLYVDRIDPVANTVTLVDEGRFLTEGFATGPAHWIADTPALPLSCEARVRHARYKIPVEVESSAGGLTVRFRDKIKKPSPGQTAAFYLGDELLGGAEILA